MKTHKKLKLVSEHQKSITDMQCHRDGTMFISSSKVSTHTTTTGRPS